VTEREDLPDDMTCAEFVELVTAFLEGALDPADGRRVADHLALCDGCTAYLDQTRRTVDALGDLPPDRLAPGTREALMAAFRERPPDV
jgi:anti-sigma factor RsiW